MTGDPPASQALADPESIEGVAGRLEEWSQLAAPGIVWVRYVSDVSRDLLLSRLSKKLRIARVDFNPPDVSQGAQWLEHQLRLHSQGDPLPIIAVLFSFPSADADLVGATFRPLNLRREVLARIPAIQLWCVPLSIAAIAEAEASDLASWFQVKLLLTETPAGRLSPADQTIVSRWRERTEHLDSFVAEVDKRRQVAAIGGESSSPNLARALNNLAVKQSQLGQRLQALASIQEAVTIYRELARSQPDALLPDLATSLNNLGLSQSNLGQRAEALASIEQAVTILRDLARSQPDAFLPHLAMSLNNLGLRQSDLGQRAEALASIEQAVTIYRDLARSQPDAFLPDLATSHGAWGNILKTSGAPTEAIEKFAEGLRLITPLAQKLREAHLPLAQTLANAYREACQSAAMQPDLALLQPIINLFQNLPPKEPNP